VFWEGNDNLVVRVKIEIKLVLLVQVVPKVYQHKCTIIKEQPQFLCKLAVIEMPDNGDPFAVFLLIGNKPRH
jgi:hypothetical protein